MNNFGTIFIKNSSAKLGENCLLQAKQIGYKINLWKCQNNPIQNALILGSSSGAKMKQSVLSFLGLINMDTKEQCNQELNTRTYFFLTHALYTPN